MRRIPYCTTDDESQWCGHIWRQRSSATGPWGFAWEVIPPFGDTPDASGWRHTQESAKAAMLEVLKRKQGAE